MALLIRCTQSCIALAQEFGISARAFSIVEAIDPIWDKKQVHQLHRPLDPPGPHDNPRWAPQEALKIHFSTDPKIALNFEVKDGQFFSPWNQAPRKSCFWSLTTPRLCPTWPLMTFVIKVLKTLQKRVPPKTFSIPLAIWIKSRSIFSPMTQGHFWSDFLSRALSMICSMRLTNFLFS